MQSLLILMLDDLLRHEIAPSDIVLGCCLRKQMVGSNCAWKWLMPATGFCVSPSPSESELNLILFEWNIKAKIYKCVFMNRLTSTKDIYLHLFWRPRIPVPFTKQPGCCCLDTYENNHAKSPTSGGTEVLAVYHTVEPVSK